MRQACYKKEGAVGLGRLVSFNLHTLFSKKGHGFKRLSKSGKRRQRTTETAGTDGSSNTVELHDGEDILL